MKKTITLFPILFFVLLLLPACNLPSPNETEEGVPVVVTVRVSTVTEYRAGPGQAYGLVGTFNPGQVIEAVGRSPDGAYLLIRDPSSPAAFWWIKNEFSPLTGDLLNLPISPPPPPPNTIAVTASVDGCPTLVGGGPTPVSCGTAVPPSDSGCPTPIGGGPTPISCGATIPDLGGGCPTPIGGGPTPVSCSGGGSSGGGNSGNPTPVGGGNSGNPTPIGGPPNPEDNPTPVGGGSNTEPTPVK